MKSPMRGSVLKIEQEQHDIAVVESSREKSTRCISCGGSRWELAREGFDLYRPDAGNFRLERCLDCGHVMQIPAPTAAALSEAYSVGYGCYRAAWSEPGWPIWKVLREITTWRRIWRLKHFAKRGKLLEVGSGAGDFLYAAKRAGWEVCGVEYNTECADALRSQAGIDVRPGELLPGCWEAGTFDAVAFWAVVEHLPDPLGTLKLAADYLKPGGVVFIQVPACDCANMGRYFGPYLELLDLPRHLNFFSRDSLTSVCRQAGLQLVKSEVSFTDVVWCYVASVGNSAEGESSKFKKALKLGLGSLYVVLLLPWLAARAWAGHGTEAFAVAIKR